MATTLTTTDKSQLETLTFDYFQALFTKAQENTILIMDDMGVIIEVNDAFIDCFGYASEDIVGSHMEILFTEEDRQKNRPQNEIIKVLSEGQASDNNYLVCKNKSIIWVSGESVLLKTPDGKRAILKIIQDIHSQKTSENSLARLNDFNENILTSIEDVVLVVDERMNVIKANRAFYGIFEIPFNDTLICFENIIANATGFQQLKTNFQNALTNSGAFKNTIIELEDAEGNKRFYDVNCNSLPENEGRKNMLLVIHDISIHKQLEKHREDVIGFVAHELRNPLANLTLCNDLMMEYLTENNTEQVNHLLQRSKNNVLRLTKMIAELYDATGATSGNMKLDISYFNFRDMVDEAIETVQVLHPSYKILVDGDGNIEVNADRFRLTQVVTNYLSNSIKYSSGQKEVMLKIDHTPNEINVSVTDNGIGISAEQLPYVFNRFFRVEKTKDLEGIGLGLYLSRQIVQAHKGRVWAESQEGKGSTFYFTIPIM